VERGDIVSSTTIPHLRGDVQLLIQEHVAIFKQRSGETNPWWLYSEFKRALSHRCGWDAPAGRESQWDFDAGIQRYLDVVGL
jgi:hypothetical protein